MEIKFDRPKHDMTHAIFDLDTPAFASASTSENRKIVVTHKASGRQVDFKNVTEFYGKSGKGGWLAERNLNRTSPFTIDEFDIETVQTPISAKVAFKSVNTQIENLIRELSPKTKKGYVGKGDVFRHDLATLLPYKGNRIDNLKPLFVDDVKDYLVRKYDWIELVTDIEVDDQVVIDCLGNKNSYIVSIDKDNYSQPVNVYNPNKPEWGIINANCFGNLWIEERAKNKEVRGWGRKFAMFQLICGDAVDNVKPSQYSDKSWGKMSAYNALKDCSDDKDLLYAVVNYYKQLYPEIVDVKTFRGDITIDWEYVANETWKMIRMLRNKGEINNQPLFTDILKKYKIK